MSSMLRTTPLIARLVLGGLILGSAAVAPEAAWAQAAPVFDTAGGLVELVTPTGIVGDGATAADLYIVALSPAGVPMTGIKGKPTATSGTTTELVDLGGGLYRFTFTPPRTESVMPVNISMKGKLPTKESYARTWSFTVSPPRGQLLTVATNPAQLVLSQDLTASIAINLAGGDRQNLTGVDLTVRPSAGSVDNLIPLGGGQFSALYTAPTVKYPHLALFTVVDRRDPSRAYAALAVPLVGKADYPVTVAPNARVILKVGGREFGPIAADAMGRATVPIIVPPGASNATRVQITPDGQVTEEPLDLKIPEARRIALFPSAAAIPSDSRLQVPVRAMVVTPDGKPDEKASVVFSTTAGVVSAATHEGKGIYVATYTPPNGNATAQATLAVNLADKPALQADSLLVNLVPARPTQVLLTTEPATLPASAQGFKVFAKVTGPDGAGLGGRTINFNANGARLKEAVKDLRNGDYQAVFSTTGSGPVELSANVSSANTGNPLARVLLLPARESLPGDGVSNALLTVATVDEYGYPVPNQAVTIKVAQGDGTLPAQATTDENGIAQIVYTAGRKNGVVSLTASVGDLGAAATLIQAPTGVGIPDLPVSATKAVAALVGEWQASLVGVRLEREGLAGAVIAAPVPVVSATTAAGAPAKMGLLSDPATVSAGGNVVLKVSVLDANGRGVGGQQLDFLTSTGTVGAVTDLGGGAYQATLAVPPGTTGEVKISAATRDGSISTFMRVPIGGAEAAWGSNPFASTPADPFAATATPTTAAPTTVAPVMVPVTTGATAPTTTTTTTVSRAPVAGDRPWLRVRAGYSYTGYNYEQLKLDQSPASVLFPEAIGLGAGAQGFQVAGRLWVPGLPYLGANVEVRAGRYTLDPEPLCKALGRPCAAAEPVGDWLVDAKVLAAGRYPFDVGATQFWIGAQAGWSQSDVQVYKVIDNAIELDQLSINSLAIGPEVGVEIGQNLFFHTYFLEHLAGFTTPFNTQFGVDGGYAFGSGAGLAPYVSAAYDFSARKVNVENAGAEPVGEISDAQHAVTVSIGIQL